MGRLHARVYRELPDVQLVGVSDIEPAAVQAVAEAYSAEAFSDHRRLLDRLSPTVVTVATPTSSHHRVVMDAIAAGAHVLVEKPIASTLAEAEEMIAAAAAAGVVLMVGHIERYNTAVLELRRQLEQGVLGRVFQINARRLGPFPSRILDVGVVIDLATHDLDVMRFLTKSEGVRAYAETRRRFHTSQEDQLTGLVTFENEMVGSLDINWLTPTKIREISVTGERGMFQVDYLMQDLYFFENAQAAGERWDAIQVLRGVNEGAMTRFALAKKEPLRTELETFIRAAGGDRVEDAVTGQDGLEALRLALALVESGRTNQPVELAR